LRPNSDEREREREREREKERLQVRYERRDDVTKRTVSTTDFL
jgi:hypothetical protein